MTDSTSGNVQVAILTYGKRAHHLERVLEALVETRHLLSRILVVDNGSTSDIDRDRARSIPVEWVNLPRNLGSAGGYHKALELASTRDESLWLLDDDNLPEPGCLARLLDASRALGPLAVVLAHRPERPEFQEILRRGGSRPIRRNSFMAFHALGTPSGNHHGLPAREGCLPLAYFGYGGALVPAEVLRLGILPEPSLFVYHDDSDWSHRLLSAGATAWLVPDAHVRDLEVSWGGQETAGASPLFSHLVPAERAWYAVRNRAWVERRLGFGGPVWFLNAFAWVALQGLRALVRERKPIELARRLARMLDGFRHGLSTDLTR